MMPPASPSFLDESVTWGDLILLRLGVAVAFIAFAVVITLSRTPRC